MKKETIFRHELNESIQADAAMSCLKNRNNHKQLNETSDFDARFEFRKDLRELASPIVKKAYMIIRNEYGDNMWRRLGIDDCNDRGLINILTDYQKYFNITNPQELADKMLGRKSQEQEEMPSMEQNDMKQEITQVAAEALNVQDSDLDELYYIVSDILDSTGDYPEYMDEDSIYDWIELHVNEITSLLK